VRRRSDFERWGSLKRVAKTISTQHQMMPKYKDLSALLGNLKTAEAVIMEVATAQGKI
jgi:hypothetical protein